MRVSTPSRLLGVVLAAVVALGACGGGKAKTASSTTSTAPVVVTSSTTAPPEAALNDVFGVALPGGYVLVDAPDSIRSSVQEQAQSVDGAKILRAADLKVIEQNGQTIGSVTVFVLQPHQESVIPSIISGYASSQEGSTVVTTTVAGKKVSLITWSGGTRIADAASSSQILVITDVHSRAQLDTLTPPLVASIE